MKNKHDVTLLDDFDKDRSWSDCRDSGMLTIIENFNLAYVLSALDRTGIANLMVEFKTFVASDIKNIDHRLLEPLLRYLTAHQVLDVNSEGLYQLTSQGKKLLAKASLAQLGFYVEAYGDVIANIPGLLDQSLEYGKDVKRDGKALAEHCATLFSEYHTSTIFEALDHLAINNVLDLGCGAGQFLIEAATLDSQFSGIGLDNSPEAIESAAKAAEKAGVGDRIQFFVADAFNQDTWPKGCFEVDAVLAVGVIHESFRNGEISVIKLLNSFAKLLESNVQTFLLGEPEIRYDLENSDSDLLLVHIFTNQGFPRPREEWLRVIAQSKLECRRIYTRANAGPRFNFFDLKLETLNASKSS